jgi:hypothetical protein
MDVLNPNQTNKVIEGTIPWRHSRASVSWDQRQPKLQGTGRQGTKILDFLKTKTYQAYVDWFLGAEDDFWSGPTGSTDVETPFGLKGYWLTYSATTGFNGGNHTNFSSGPGGINCTTYPRYKHYTFNFTDVTQPDAIGSIRTAQRKTGFKPVVPNPQIPIVGLKPRRVIYTVESVIKPMEDLAKGQNDAAGYDLGYAHGTVYINRVPVRWVPWLEANESDHKPLVLGRGF